jgi:hypothetical protein
MSALPPTAVIGRKHQQTRRLFLVAGAGDTPWVHEKPPISGEGDFASQTTAGVARPALPGLCPPAGTAKAAVGKPWAMAGRNKFLAEATSGDYSNVLYTCMERVEVR